MRPCKMAGCGSSSPASGSIGSGIAAFLRPNHEVVGIDRRPGPHVTNLHDLCDGAALEASLAGADAVVHVAALHAPDVGRAPDAEFRRVNVEGTERLLDLAARRGVSRFVYTSSTSVYGHALEPEDEAAWIDEEVAPRPRDIYDWTKLEAEGLVRAASGSGLLTAILRMSRCFPEPHREMAIHRLHRGIDRRDVARAHALALAAASSAAETYLISAQPVFDRQDCRALFNDPEALVRQRLPHVAERFDRMRWSFPSSIGRVYSPAKAVDALRFQPHFGVESVLNGDCDPSPSG